VRLILQGITKGFPADRATQETKVLDGIDGQFDAGRFVSIVGPSGCGKTTLLRIIAGLEEPTSGKVILEEGEEGGRGGGIGLVFQEYALFPWRTTLGNIEMGLEIKGQSRDERRLAAMEYVRTFSLAGFENHYPHQLSGGMQQRVAIARTLIMKPSLVLMDEPFGSLDSQTRNSMQIFLLDVCRNGLYTIVFVTHNVDEAVFLSDEIVVFSSRPGRVIKRFMIPFPRPRERTSPEFNAIRRDVLSILQAQRAGGESIDDENSENGSVGRPGGY
jgi:NitT/TauT family transport system ATP-binding protein